MIRRTVTIKTHVPLIVATLALDVSILLKKLMTKMHVPRIGVIPTLEKSNTKELFVMTRTHVP